MVFGEIEEEGADRREMGCVGCGDNSSKRMHPFYWCCYITLCGNPI